MTAKNVFEDEDVQTLAVRSLHLHLLYFMEKESGATLCQRCVRLCVSTLCQTVVSRVVSTLFFSCWDIARVLISGFREHPDYKKSFFFAGIWKEA